jgi:hypothetical protein
MWRMPQTSDYSYPRVTTIRIDVHPAGKKPDQHITYASHASPRMLVVRFLQAVPIRDNLSWVMVNESRPTAPEKKGSQHNPQHAADWSAGLYPASLSSQLMKQWGQRQASINGRLLGLLGPHHQYAIVTFNTCSWGPTKRSLTNTSGGYNIEGVNFPCTTPRPSWLVVSHFP